MEITKTIYFAVTLTAISLQSCSSYQENNTAYDFETIEIPVTNEISFSDAESEINSEINIFGIHTFSKIVIAKPNENIAYSPISALLAISVYHNTKMKVYGNESDLNSLIGGDNIEDLNSTCNKLLRFLPYSNNTNSNICFANSVWLNNQIKTQPSLKNFLNTEFYAELYRYNPYTDLNENSLSERVRKWVEIKTKGDISDYKISGDDSSSLVYNVTYFKEEWLNKFDATKTETGIFYGSNGNTAAEMMRGDFSNINFYETINWQAVSLPLNGNYDVFFILPEPNVPLEEVLNVFDISSRTNSTNVDLSIRLPKFSISNNLDLSSFISDDFGASLKQITKFEIDENGAKAVAATEVTDSAEPAIKKDITFNRPFLYALVNRITGTPIMLGYICTF